MSEPKTLTITEFGGPLTRRSDGDINSGLAKYDSSWGYDPYSKPGNLTWMEQPTSVLTSGTQVIVAMTNYYTGGNNEIRLVAGQASLIGIKTSTGSTAPNADTVSILGTVTGIGDLDQTQVGIVKFGATTEKLFVGGDDAIVKVNVDGSSRSVVTDGVSGFNTNRPRPMSEFIGKIYFGNGNNIGEIDSTETVTTATKLSPSFPQNTYVVDLDTTPDGNYMVITVNDTLLGGGSEFIGANTSNNKEARSGTSRKLYWNGIDDSFTAQEKLGGFSAYSNVSFADKDYTLGYGQSGAVVYSGTSQKLSLPKVQAPYATATLPISNMLTFGSIEFDPEDDKMKTSIFQYGQYDEETPNGLYRLLKQGAQVRDDIKSVPTALSVSNLVYYPSIFAATDHIGGVSKMYYATIESNNQGPANLLGKLWRFSLSPTGLGSVLSGTYETQTQLFSKKVQVKEVRLYTEPLVGGNDFVIDLIGSGGSVISGGSQRFQITEAGSVATGTDMVHFNPQVAPTYALGVRITNSSVTGVANWTATKLEIDYSDGGK